MDDEIKQAADGTWTLTIDYGRVKPIEGIPTRELAGHIRTQMWEMERQGGWNAQCD